jgi:RHS repeat-associated protein
MAEQTPDGQFYRAHNDHLNSTRKLTSTSGAVVYRGEFDPYGKAALETGSVSLNSHKFTGYERDWATGLDYAQARMYTSQYGRFMQSDPVTQGCGNRNPEIPAGANQRLPESLNRYGYVRNDPVNLIDPSGLYGLPPEEADLLCAMGVLEFCGWPGGGRTPECYYSKAGCGSGGGGGWGEPIDYDWQPRRPRGDWRNIACTVCTYSCGVLALAAYVDCRLILKLPHRSCDIFAQLVFEKCYQLNCSRTGVCPL